MKRIYSRRHWNPTYRKSTGPWGGTLTTALSISFLVLMKRANVIKYRVASANEIQPVSWPRGPPVSKHGIRGPRPRTIYRRASRYKTVRRARNWAPNIPLSYLQSWPEKQPSSTRTTHHPPLLFFFPLPRFRHAGLLFSLPRWFKVTR